jgi:tetratricopeptide (TPR) repeat protein
MIEVVLQIETKGDKWQVSLRGMHALVDPLVDSDLSEMPQPLKTWDEALMRLGPEADWRLDELTMRALGDLIRQRVISGRVAALLAKDEAEAKGAGVPLRYVVDIFEDDSSPLLHKLPFELLCDQTFWFRRANTIGVRRAPYSDEGEAAFGHSPSALVAWASMPGSAPDDEQLALHGEAIRAAFSTAGFTTRIAAKCSKEELRSEIARGCDLLYIACHGAEDLASYGILVLADDTVTGSELGEWIYDAGAAGHRVQAVMICACSGAAPSAGTGARSMAQHVASGELAMTALGFRTPVRVDWALDLMKRVLEKFARGETLERAIARARSDLPATTPDWSLPLVFTRRQRPHRATILPEARATLSLSPPQERYALLPAPPRDYFTARQSELATLRTWLSSPGSAVLAAGEGGIGKSEIARSLAFEAHREGRNVIWLERADRDLPNSLIALIRQADPTYERRTGATQEDLRATMQRTLGAASGLLVLDDLSSGQDVAFLTPGANWNVLVTSRDHVVLPGALRQEVGPLLPLDAQLLLARLVYEADEIPIDDVAAARRVLEALGGIPLFIELAAAQLSRGIPLDELHALLGSGTSDIHDRAQRIISSTLDLLPPKDLEAWHLIAALPSAGANARNIAVGLQESEDSASRRLYRLRNASLLRFVPLEQRHTMHPLARIAAKAHAATSGKWEKALENAANAILDVARWCNRPVGDNTNLAPERWKEHRSFFETIDLSLWSVETPAAEGIARAIGLVDQFSFATPLPEENVRTPAIALPTDAKTEQRLLTALALAGSPETRAILLLRIGIARSFLSNFMGAETALTEAIQLSLSRTGEPSDGRRLLAEAYRVRGDVRRYKNQLDKADEDYRDAFLQLDEDNKQGRAALHTSQAQLRQRQGRSNEAVAEWTAAIDLYRATNDDRGLSNAFFARGDSQRRQAERLQRRRPGAMIHVGLFQAAEQDLEAAAALVRTTKEELVTANVLRALGDLERVHRRYESAKIHLTDASVLFRQIPDMFGLADSLISLADIAADEGNLRLASDLCNEAEPAAQQLDYGGAVTRIRETRRWIALLSSSGQSAS